MAHQIIIFGEITFYVMLDTYTRKVKRNPFLSFKVSIDRNKFSDDKFRNQQLCQKYHSYLVINTCESLLHYSLYI